MASIRTGLIQVALKGGAEDSPEAIRERMIEAHVPFIEVDPRGRILAEASEDSDELIIADLDLDMVREVRDLWQFFRDRRPEMYGDLTEI